MDSKTETFEAARSRLIGLAYRLLGSISDAQDAVQDTYIKWVLHEDNVDIPIAWLTRVCTNHCLDQLQSAHHKRVDYVGQWLPEPIQIEFEDTIEKQIEMASSLTTAFLLLLERLTPKERAAYILHDIFSMSFDEVAAILELQPANCRKLATRAREHVIKNKGLS
ncbi:MULTISPECIES: sigma-70 family RNA polymerase sigma factor [Psychrobacter]|uniref:sigma-70 family RNA polymerase sigma factor n=1 Tax=Psychrobacter TaxID=497 RepID=UPI003FD4A16E